MNWEQTLSLENLLGNFPSDTYAEIRSNQKDAFELIAREKRSLTLELPTGSGKTALGMTVLKAMEQQGLGPLFYIVPNKTQVDQVKAMFPEVTVAYGRNEYDCLYYEPEETYKADEVPCLSLTNCPHRVDQQTGETYGKEVHRCPYYDAKHKAKQSSIVVCTMSFYLYTMLFSREFDRPAGLVIDEVHRIAEVVRGALSYDITDWHLSRSIKLLKQLDCTPEAKKLEDFLEKMTQILRQKRSSRTGERLLSDSELLELMSLLKKVNVAKVEEKVSSAISSGKIDLVKDRDTLKQLETVARALPRYIRSLEYSAETSKRKPLNFVTFGYSDESAKDDDERVNYKLVVEANYVAPIVRKMMGELTIAYSATVGDSQVFGYETGIQFPFYSLPGQFPAENTRVFMPTDTPNLAKKVRSRQEPTKVLRKVAKTCGRLGEAGERALVVTVSNAERDKFVWLCHDEGVDVITYGEGVTPREAVARFKHGEGTVLVGTSANYGEGIDLPEGMATAAFFLRPGYPNPSDPRAQFELRRYGSQAWMVWNWRVMIEALQVRGRNVRSADDLGVTIFISQQFRRFLFGSLPEWLRSAYRRDLTLEQCEEETMELLRTTNNIQAH